MAASVREALSEQRLVRMMAGIQWPRHGNRPPTVYFVKVSPRER